MLLSFALHSTAEDSSERFDFEKDLLLAHFDSKTDVDDIHSIAAFATIVAHRQFSGLRYHAVAGAYGIQEGLYVPANELFEMAFENQWSDAHLDFHQALSEVHTLVSATLEAGGNIWIAECGQSDFTAAIVRTLKTSLPNIDTQHRITVVQHSDWNEGSAHSQKLQYVKEETNYHKIPDGNRTGNGTSGFNSSAPIDWAKDVKDPHLRQIWETAIAIANRYNGKEGRYLNQAIADGGLDFSDMAEVTWIFELDKVPDAVSFFSYFSK